MAPEHGARAELAGERQVLLAQDLLHQRLLVVRVVDDEPPADPDRLAVLAQDAGTERVERAGQDVAAALADQADDPFAQLGGGPVRERDGQDPPGADVLDADEVGDPMGQHPGLAGSGAGQDQERSLRRGDGPRLLRVERVDDLRGSGREGRGPGGRDRPGAASVSACSGPGTSRIQAGSSGGASGRIGELDEGRTGRPQLRSAASSSVGLPGRRRRVGLTPPL